MTQVDRLELSKLAQDAANEAGLTPWAIAVLLLHVVADCWVIRPTPGDLLSTTEELSTAGFVKYEVGEWWLSLDAIRSAAERWRAERDRGRME